MIALKWRLLKLAYEEDVRQRKIRLLRTRAHMRATNNPLVRLSETEFIKRFRLSKNSVKELIAEITPLLPQNLRCVGISPELKVLIALAFYATGSYQTLVGQNLHNVSQVTVSRAVRQVTEALYSSDIFSKYIRWPTQSEELNDIVAKFHQKFDFPGVLGCVGGTHVAILRPSSHEERYLNRKGFHSLNVMIVCDSELNILWVDASNPGSADDLLVWNNCSLNSQHVNLSNRGEPIFLLGSSGYPLRKCLMTPILNTVDGTPEHHFYMKHAQAHDTVEQCIRTLKTRFKCLLAARRLHYSPVMASKIVNACCILHNIANKTQAPLPPLSPAEARMEAVHSQQDEELRAASESVPQGVRCVNRDLLDGRAMQQSIVDRLWREK